MEEKKFTKINGREYAESLIATDPSKVVVAKKFARVFARRGVIGEEIISYSQNGIVEKVDTVKEDSETKQPGWVLTKLDENGNVLVDEYGHRNEWIVKDSTFVKKYDCDEQMPEGVYKPKDGLQFFIPIVMDVILEQWGGEMKIEAGGWLNITNPSEIYGISKRDFEDTYRIVGEEPNYKLSK